MLKSPAKVRASAGDIFMRLEEELRDIPLLVLDVRGDFR
jgi:hypothetical protein